MALKPAKASKIQAWVDSIQEQPIEEVSGINKEHTVERDAKRTRLNSYLVSDPPDMPPFPDPVLPHTPSPTVAASESGQSTGPRGRKRPGDPINVGSGGDNTSQRSSYIPKLQPTSNPSFQPSPCRPPKAPNPVKSSLELKLLTKPVYIKPLGRRTVLPDDVTGLHSQIRSIRSFSVGIIPNEVRELLSELAEEPLHPSVFCTSASVGGTSAAETVLSELCTIHGNAHSSKLLGRYESGWNHFVHTPLLTLAFRPEGHFWKQKKQSIKVRMEPVMNAVISPNSAPRMKGANPPPGLMNIKDDTSVLSLRSASERMSVGRVPTDDSNRSPSTNQSHTDNPYTSDRRKVDYVVVLDLEDEVPLKQWITYVLSDLRVVGGDRSLHVNQTEYKAISDSPIGLSIESKKSSSTSDPLMQLSIWVAAWHNRMYHLRARLLFRRDEHLDAATDATTDNVVAVKLVSVPLIAIIGHEWQLYFACDNGDSITVYGPVQLGSTETFLGMYMIVASLKAIEAWTKKTFYEALQVWFTVKETARDEEEE